MKRLVWLTAFAIFLSGCCCPPHSVFLPDSMQPKGQDQALIKADGEWRREQGKKAREKANRWIRHDPEDLDWGR